MELLGYVGHVESRFRLLGDSVSVGARYVMICAKGIPRLRDHFGRTRWCS
jgi:hypothetical protein